MTSQRLGRPSSPSVCRHDRGCPAFSPSPTRRASDKRFRSSRGRKTTLLTLGWEEQTARPPFLRSCPASFVQIKHSEQAFAGVKLAVEGLLGAARPPPKPNTNCFSRAEAVRTTFGSGLQQGSQTPPVERPVYSSHEALPSPPPVPEHLHIDPIALTPLLLGIERGQAYMFIVDFVAASRQVTFVQVACPVPGGDEPRGEFEVLPLRGSLFKAEPPVAVVSILAAKSRESGLLCPD
jgi:hypothetical protein